MGQCCSSGHGIQQPKQYNGLDDHKAFTDSQTLNLYSRNRDPDSDQVLSPKQPQVIHPTPSPDSGRQQTNLIVPTPSVHSPHSGFKLVHDSRRPTTVVVTQENLQSNAGPRIKPTNETRTNTIDSGHPQTPSLSSLDQVLLESQQSQQHCHPERVDPMLSELCIDTQHSQSGNVSNEPPSLPGFNCLDKKSFDIDVPRTSRSLIRQQAGYKIHIPVDCIRQPTKIWVEAAMAGLFEFPENTSSVSGVVRVCLQPEVVLEKQVTLELEHCCTIESDQNAQFLSFAVAGTTTGEYPYRFNLVRGGVFSPGYRYGSISVSKFSLWVIVRSSIRAVWNWLAEDNISTSVESDKESDSDENDYEAAPNLDKFTEELESPVAVKKPTYTDVCMYAPRRYIAHIYYLALRGRAFIWRVVLGIVQDLALCSFALVTKLTNNFPYKEYDSFLVKFKEGNIISLEGVEADSVVGGWKIQPLRSTEIRSDEIDNLDGSDYSILAKCTIKLSFIWNGNGPPELLDHKVRLRGAQAPHDYFYLVLDPFEGLPQQPAETGHLLPQNLDVTVPTFKQLINHMGLSKHFIDQTCADHILDKISALLPNWQKYAEALGLSDLQIQDIKTDLHLDVPMRAKRVMKVWHQNNGFKATYSRFIEVCLEQKQVSLAEKICKMLKDLQKQPPLETLC